MKISFNYKALIAAVALSTGLFSCSKLDKDYEPIQVSGLSIIQASPTLEKLDVYVDNTKATGLDFSFGDKTDYLSAYSGNRVFNVTKKGNSNSLKGAQATLKPQIGYSLFVIDKLENINFLLLEDDLSKPATGKAKIRFVNLSPDAGALNLSINGATSDLFTNKLFKEYTTFQDIDPAEQMTFNVKDQATGTVVTVLANVKIEVGKVYTLYAKGLKANTDDTKFGATVFVHK
ncbi:DUF4397 domain-containing protein [Pedobacter sp. ASV28]|uniref:DUF4397 domain-containing protein n=1 Tax=Pedobacter sp. ASV28 TaxID=2795123 RepID=UPI0018EB8663|nr:DUF4397 domain-containing protein [Pedobacter sp. ASV28]